MIVEDLINIKHGQEVVYHTGLLSKDRSREHSKDGKADIVNDIANRAIKMYSDDKVTLVQKRLYDGIFEYIAIGKE